MHPTANRPAIIIPLDGSETATRALGAAEAMAALMGAALHIVHVTEEPLAEEQLLGEMKIERKIQVEDCVLHQIIGGDPVVGVLRYASDVDTEMIVMSSHGWTYNPERLLGETATGLLRRAVNPVMVIRPDMLRIPEASWRPKKMLVPQEGTPTAAAVIHSVFRLAALLGVDVDVLSIKVAGERLAEVGAMPPPRYLDHPGYDWPAWASEFAQRFLAERPPQVQLRVFGREGAPAEVLTKFGLENGDDLIALGWHGHLEFGRATVVKDLIRHAELPLVLIWSRE